MTDARTADVIIIGGGIAGASLAARLAGTADVIILEMEDRPGYHATGRSAAMYEPGYGPPVIQALTRASGDFLHSPPEGFAPAVLVSPRGALMVGEPGDEALLATAIGHGFHEITAAEARERMPLLRCEKLIGYLWDGSAKDIDVDLLHQAFLRQHRRAGGHLVCNAPVTAAQP